MKVRQLVVSVVFLFSVAVAVPRNFDDVSSPVTSSYVMIGNSKESYKKLADGDENHRSSYSQKYPSKPSSDYYQYSYDPYYNPSPLPPQPPVSANVNLLEPFMLVTFLLFALSLMEKARSPPRPYFARNDFLQELPVNFTQPTDHQQRFLNILNTENF